MDISSVEKIISTYLNQQHVHGEFKVKEIKNETISTYDGQYPSFEVIYEGKQPNFDMTKLSLTEGIQKYTNLRSNVDYWIGITWETKYL